MYLFLSAQDIRIMDLAWLSKDGAILEAEQKQTPPEGFLLFLDSFMKERDILWMDVKGLILVCGPGSFTASRIITTISNTISFAHDFPIVPLENSEKKSVGDLLGGLDLPNLLERNKRTRFVSPVYDRPPHITYPKKK